MSERTPDEIYAIRRIVSRWLQIKAKWEGRYADDRAVLNRLAPDADHSALLYRLLEGKEPLPEPPPLVYSYPDYSAADTLPDAESVEGEKKKLDNDNLAAAKLRLVEQEIEVPEKVAEKLLSAGVEGMQTIVYLGDWSYTVTCPIEFVRATCTESSTEEG